MSFHFDTKEQLFSFIQSNIIGSTEAAEILGNLSRQRFNRHVLDGNIIPIKNNPSLFYRPDIEAYAPILEAKRMKYRPFE